MTTELQKCRLFLRQNGWKIDGHASKGTGYTTYVNGSLCAVDINDEEVVLVDDTGDYLHLPLNYYALVGALIEHRQLATNYTSWNSIKH